MSKERLSKNKDTLRSFQGIKILNYKEINYEYESLVSFNPDHSHIEANLLENVSINITRTCIIKPLLKC